MRISTIILAAGESKRMGKQKLLLPFGEKTIIEKVMNNLLDSKVNEILVILGANSKKIKKKIKSFPVKVTVNPRYKKGMLSSVQWGFKKIGKDMQAVLICLGDQPLIPTYVINRTIDSYKKSKKGIIIPAYKKKRGHPVLINVKYREEIKKLDSDIGLRSLMYDHQEDILEVDVNTPAILKDIDNQDDYCRLTSSAVLNNLRKDGQ